MTGAKWSLCISTCLSNGSSGFANTHLKAPLGNRPREFEAVNRNSTNENSTNSNEHLSMGAE